MGLCGRPHLQPNSKLGSSALLALARVDETRHGGGQAPQLSGRAAGAWRTTRALPRQPRCHPHYPQVLASVHEHAGQEDNARALYQRLAADHPQAEVRREARNLLASVRARTRRLSGEDDGWPWAAWRWRQRR